MKDLTPVKALAAEYVNLQEQHERGQACSMAFERFGIKSTPEEWVKVYDPDYDGWRLILRPGLYLDFTTSPTHSVYQPRLTRYYAPGRAKRKRFETSRSAIWTANEFLGQLREWGIEL